jgi:hypothetical protein
MPALTQARSRCCGERLCPCGWVIAHRIVTVLGHRTVPLGQGQPGQLAPVRESRTLSRICLRSLGSKINFLRATRDLNICR